MSRKARIEKSIAMALSPAFLTVEDESHMHHVPKGAETHFKVTAVATAFSNTTRIQRHRMLNQLLVNEFNTGLHALSMHLFTPEEWSKKQDAVLQSPTCRDGFNKGASDAQ